jgi:hypothetical protein
MKKVLFIIAIILACGSFAGNGSAQQQGMKGAIVKPGEAYNPHIVYTGRYKTDILFYKASGSEFWKRLPRFDRLRYVKCPEALQQLNQAGLWKGSLSFKNGSCIAAGRSGAGTSDPPTEWALGNWLNYNEQANQQVGN